VPPFSLRGDLGISKPYKKKKNPYKKLYPSPLPFDMLRVDPLPQGARG